MERCWKLLVGRCGLRNMDVWCYFQYVFLFDSIKKKACLTELAFKGMLRFYLKQKRKKIKSLISTNDRVSGRSATEEDNSVRKALSISF